MTIIFESHSTTVDNESQVCSGWNDAALSELGEQQARQMSQRYKLEDFDAIYCSDLQRSYKTAQIAFPEVTSQKLFLDWRLRECDYGDMTLRPSKELDSLKVTRLTEPFPGGGESYDEAMKRMKSFIDDLKTKNYKKILVIGSRATHYGFDHWIDGIGIKELVSTPMVWQPGWTYELLSI